MKKTTFTLFLLFTLLARSIYAQNHSYEWAQRTGNTSYYVDELPSSVTTDNAGNVYTVGRFAGVLDFDAGAGAYNLTSNRNYDIFVSKKDALGNLIWARSMGGSGFDYANSVSVDQLGHVYLSGVFQNTVDFDPGTGVYNITSYGDYDFFITKLDSSGNLMWAKQIGSTGPDAQINDLVVDSIGNVYAAGAFGFTLDFDPGIGVYNLSPVASSYDAFVLKLDSGGFFKWAKQFSSSRFESCDNICLDQLQNVYTSGLYSGTVDFDPGSSTSNLTSTVGGQDVFITKLDSAGNFVWAKSIGGTNYKYTGSIKTDSLGNLYSIGWFYGTVDFDPGAGTSNLIASASTSDIFILKLDVLGNFRWVKSMGGTSNDRGLSLAVEAQGAVYTTGYFEGSGDFDPGTGVSTLTSNGNSDVFISKLDSSGAYQWVYQLGGTGDENAYALTLDKWKNLYTVGYFSTTVDFDPGAGVSSYTATLSGTTDMFLQKLTPFLPSVGGNLSAVTPVCNGNSSTLTLTAYVGDVVRWESSVSPFTTWTPIIHTAATYTTAALTQTTKFRVLVQSGARTSAISDTATVTVVVSIGGTISGSSSACIGSPAGTLTLSGNTGNIVGWESSVSPFSTWTTISNTASTYTSGTLTATTKFRAVVQSGSCASAISDTATVTINPTSIGGTVSGGSAAICSGSTSGTLTLSGHTGSIVRWESSASPFTTWTTIANTTATYISDPLTATTKFRAVVKSGSCAEATSADVTKSVISSGTWLGASSSDWNDASNWCGGVPTSTTNVIINSSTPYQPLINTQATTNNITINTGATLGFTGSGNSITIFGLITNNGTFTATGGKVVYAHPSPGYTYTIPSIIYDSLTVEGSSEKMIFGSAVIKKALTLSEGLLIVTNSTGSLQMDSTAVINGASSSSYICTLAGGKLIQLNIGSTGKTGTVLFPVGTHQSYTPVYLTNAGDADNFSVSVSNSVLSGGTTGPSINTHNVNRTWIIGEGVSGGSNVTLSFEWVGSDESSTYTRSSSTVSKYISGTTWQRLTSSAVTGTNPYTQSVGGISSFGLFAISDVSSALPVTFTEFTAIYTGSLTDLNWQTASETNNSHFEIERSVDGKSFEKIGQEQGAGNSNALLNYAFTDVTAQQAFASTNVLYYRLKQVDFNGESTYSAIRTVVNTTKNVFTILSVQPNPFNDKFELNFTSSSVSSVSLEITDMVGKTIHTTTLSADKGVNTFNMPDNFDMKGGVYFVRLTQNNETRTVKIVKQKQ